MGTWGGGGGQNVGKETGYRKGRKIGVEKWERAWSIELAICSCVVEGIPCIAVV
jgi:hypothetical protein